jgi:hypothetical protein
MKVFISWFGDLSKRVATLLSTWLKDVLQAIEPWLSKDDIDKGKIWFGDITEQLSNTGVGILCLTGENKDAPWILFEAGALSKGLSESRVCPFLVNLQHSDLEPPLSQFNGTLPNKEDLLQLVKTINGERKDQALTEAQLSKTFEMWWPGFKMEFDKILANYKPQKQVPRRTTEAMVEEILELSRSIQRSLQPLPAWATPYAPQFMTEELLAAGLRPKGPEAFSAIQKAMDEFLKSKEEAIARELRRKKARRISLEKSEPEDKMPDLET